MLSSLFHFIFREIHIYRNMYIVYIDDVHQTDRKEKKTRENRKRVNSATSKTTSNKLLMVRVVHRKENLSLNWKTKEF